MNHRTLTLTALLLAPLATLPAADAPKAGECLLIAVKPASKH